MCVVGGSVGLAYLTYLHVGQQMDKRLDFSFRFAKGCSWSLALLEYRGRGLLGYLYENHDLFRCSPMTSRTTCWNLPWKMYELTAMNGSNLL